MTESSTSPTTPVLKLDGVVKRYRDKTVLDGATLDVPAGSVLGLLGKNGAGKTTLLKAALGLIKPDAGTATLLGEPAWSLSADAKARLGYVPQTVTLYPWMRVRQVIDYTAAFYPRWNMALVWQLIKDWEVGADDKVGNLSVGTLQKLAIILALGPEPQLLVLDEPAASLDPAARRDFLKALLDIAVNGTRTIVFSTHITSDLERVADRVALMRDGRVVFDNDLDALKDAVKRLHVTADRPLAPDFDLPGRLRRRIAGHEALVSVRSATPDLLESIQRQHSASVRVEDLSHRQLETCEIAQKWVICQELRKRVAEPVQRVALRRVMFGVSIDELVKLLLAEELRQRRIVDRHRLVHPNRIHVAIDRQPRRIDETRRVVGPLRRDDRGVHPLLELTHRRPPFGPLPPCGRGWPQAG